MMISATGSHQRVRFEKINVTPPQNCVLHATVVAYDFDSGALAAQFDVQQVGERPLNFKPQPDGTYLDNSGRSWKLIN